MARLSSQAGGTAKENGTFYTPDAVAAALVQWAARNGSDTLLDPSCGDGQFIARHPNSVGVERDGAAAAVAKERAPGALLHQADFFTWAERTTHRFDCAAGNPPFIRYQTFKGEVRHRALNLCAELGAPFSALTASRAPFLVVTASLLRAGGRMAFVVPASRRRLPSLRADSAATTARRESAGPASPRLRPGCEYGHRSHDSRRTEDQGCGHRRIQGGDRPRAGRLVQGHDGRFPQPDEPPGRNDRRVHEHPYRLPYPRLRVPLPAPGQSGRGSSRTWQTLVSSFDRRRPTGARTAHDGWRADPFSRLPAAMRRRRRIRRDRAASFHRG